MQTIDQFMKGYCKYLKMSAMVFLLVWAMPGCISYKEVKLTQIRSVQLANNDLSSGKIVVVVSIQNPNNYAIKIKKYDLHAYANESDLGKVDVEEDIVIPKNSEQDHTITFKPDMAKILSILPSLYFAGSAEAAIRGTVKVKAMMLSKKFKVDLKKKISAADLQ